MKQVSRSTNLGRSAPSSAVQIAIALAPKDPTELANTIKRLYDPSDPLYHQFLTPDQFAETFSPTADTVKQVSDYLNANGLTVTQIHKNRLIINAQATSSQIEKTFQVEMHNYLGADGHTYYAPTSEPIVPVEQAAVFTGILGLNNFSVKTTHLRKIQNALFAQLGFEPRAAPPSTVNNYMTPSRIKSAYNLSNTSLTGSGETLALFELAGFNSSDITGYTSGFSLSTPTIQVIAVDSADTTLTTATDGGDEVTLDIELAIALAPGLGKIIVYEGPNTSAGVIDTYSRIASDGTAQEVSTSWGAPEDLVSSAELNSENTLFQEMAVQGQTIFAAAGDNGAYDDKNNPSTLIVDDPASQPYVTSVGGTSITLGTTGNYLSETTWSNSASSFGGGGGVSARWTIPLWQSGLSTTSNLGSSTFRMIPDVALDADPTTGYPIYFNGNWAVYGGTSAAAPLWAAFTALHNQQRVGLSASRIGFISPDLYALARLTTYNTMFHDIADHSTNLHYPTYSGYDLATGLGSFNGANLLAALLPPLAPSSLTLTSSEQTVQINWTASTGALSYTLMKSNSATGNFTAVAANISTLSYSDSVANNQTYYYYVQAVGTTGPGAKSITQTITIGIPLAAPTQLLLTVQSKQSILVSWTASVGANSYSVYRSTSLNGTYSQIASGIVNVTYTDTSLNAGQTYYYYVQAVDAGGMSPLSTIQFTTTTANAPAVPSAPASLSLTSINTPAVIITWPASLNTTGYIVNRSVSASGTFAPIASNVLATTYTDINVASGVTYFYTVQSVNLGGSSAPSYMQSIAAFSGDLPTAPTHLSAKVVP